MRSILTAEPSHTKLRYCRTDATATIAEKARSMYRKPLAKQPDETRSSQIAIMLKSLHHQWKAEVQIMKIRITDNQTDVVGTRVASEKMSSINPTKHKTMLSARMHELPLFLSSDQR